LHDILHAGLLNRGTPVSITDVFIAATGLRHRLTIVTNNTKDFRRFEGLSLEGWR
jgi:tRNA(fMet)-specific endonuclease VapC